MTPEEAVEFGLTQGREIATAIISDPDVVEAIADACHSIEFAYRKLMEQELPAVYVVANILAVVECDLMSKLLEPSKHSEDEIE